MLQNLNRHLLETEDWLRYSPRVRHVVGNLKLLSERTARAHDDDALARSIAKLCAAARLTESARTLHTIQQRIHQRLRLLNPFGVNWRELVPFYSDGRLVKAAILKPFVGPREPGVLFISFENQWIKLLTCRDFEDIAERYTLVLAPSSSPHNLINYVFPGLFREKIFTLISNPEDAAVLPTIAGNYVIVPLLASHWVDPARFQPWPREKRDIDLIMVAGFARCKRHHALFTALREMPRQLRILLIGQAQGTRTAEKLMEEARWYGVADRFTLLSNQDYDSVTRHMCRARASVILSRQEGSCVVVAESLFADTPMALLKGAGIGSRIFINEQTGCFLTDDGLGRQLTEFIAAADRFRPRHWAEQNIGCWQSSKRLNDILKEHALGTGREWTVDIAPLTWCPDPQLARPEDRRRLEPERQVFKERFGLEIGS